MNKDNIDRRHRYERPEEFFALRGSVVMKLTTNAAVAVCRQAAAKGLLVARVEGGIWHSPGFEARVDCIWDGLDPPVDINTAERNNLAAAEFIESESRVHDVFILTAPDMAHW